MRPLLLLFSRMFIGSASILRRFRWFLFRGATRSKPNQSKRRRIDALQKSQNRSEAFRMLALVTGGGGFLGGAIVRLLVQRGIRVRSLARGHYPSLETQGVEQIKGDIG